MKMKNSIWNLVWVCLLCSCNSWLDIKLINQSEESELFSTERGFTEALAGVYYDMSAAGLYGQTLSFGMLDVMSRTYDYSRVPNAMKIFRDYDYEDKAAYPVEKIKYIKGITEGKVTAVSRMLKLAAWLKHNYGCTMNQAIKTVIPVKDKVKQKEKRSVNLIIDEAQAQKYLDTFAKKNAKARYRLLEALIKEPVIDESIIKSKLNITAQTVKAFEDMGIAEVRSEDIYRNPVRNVTGERKHIELNKQQKNAVDTIIADYDNGDYKTYLLHGVTGSGKTEVYLEAIEHVLNKGRQAIVLIPEIALTFQTVQRFYHRFGDKVSIMNSRMSKGERYDQFLRAQ